MSSSFFDLAAPLARLGVDVVCQYCCLQIPSRDNGQWDILYPDIEWTDDTMVIMHCQDFVNVDQSGCRELQMIEQHFGGKSSRVIVVVWNIDLTAVYTGPLNVVYFPYHSYEIISNLSNIADQWITKLSAPRLYRFQSLNGVAKPHRVKTVELLDKFDSARISLHPDRPIAEFSYTDHLTVTNEENFLKLLPVYGSCDVNVVTESLYDFYPGIITEKSIFAWLSLQVPLLIGYPGMIKHARWLGFDMFDDILDNSYDSAPNSTRVEAAIEFNRPLLSSGVDREKLLPRLVLNQQHAMSWPVRMANHYQSCIEQIYRCTTGA
jgi:hypothetical protein